MLLSMMLPAQVLMIPQYLWYQKLGWVGSYKPLIIPYFFAIQGFFVYQISNFIDGIPRELDEAAKIDGAGRLQLIRYVDIPAIMPTCAILLIMNMGSVLNVGFDKIYLMQNSLNMPATEVIATYTYKIGIINGQYSYSTAIGLFNTLVNFIFLITANAIAKRVSDTSIF